MTNENPNWHPPSYRTFYLYNITSPTLDLYRGKRPTVERVGPYVFRKWWSRYNVEFSSDENFVSYEAGVRYEFDSEKSGAGLSVDDPIVQINLPYLGALELAQIPRNQAFTGPIFPRRSSHPVRGIGIAIALKYTLAIAIDITFLPSNH